MEIFNSYRDHYRNFDIPEECEETEFNLELPFSDNWKESPNRMMIIIGHVDRDDLSTGRLFDPKQKAYVALSNTMTYARRTVKKFQPEFNAKEWAHCAINFNLYRTYSQTEQFQTTADTFFRKRVLRYIKKMDPTHIFILSDQVARVLIGDQISFFKQKSYNVFNCELAGKTRKVNTTIEFCRTFDFKANTAAKQSESEKEETSSGMACLLGFIARNAAALYGGDNLFPTARGLKANPILIKTIKQFDKFYEELCQQKVISFDSEWMSENWSVKDAKFLTNQFSWNKEECYVVPLYHYESPFTGKELAYVEKKLRDFFRDTAAKKKYMLIQNAQADLTMVRVLFGIPVLYWNVIDTISAELALDENLRFISNFRKDKNYSLDTLLSHYGSFFYLDETTFGKSERGTLKDTPLEGDALNYCAMDSQSLLAIFEGQLFRASKENFGYDGKESYLKTFKKFVSLQMSNNMHAVSTMEQYGTPIDVELIQKSLLPGSDFSDEWKKLGETFYAYPSVKKANKILLKEKSKAAQSIFGGVENVFSITSPDHLKLLFFGVLGLEPVSFTKKKEVSVDDIFQDFYKDSIPEVATYQEFQKYNKLKNTYLVGWYKKIAAHPDSSRDFRIRPNYGFYRVVTGRSNSSNPSLQQIPARHHSAKYIKRLFAAPVGHLGIKLDYSAHEVRGLSIAAGDKPLAEAFRLGRELRRKYIVKPLQELWKRIELDGDVHKLNCSFIMKIPIESVTKELRSAFKAIIFGLIYGKGLSTLANDIKKTKEETEKILGQFFQRFKRSKIWLDWAVKTGRELLYVYSPFGRKRNLYAYLTGMADMCAAMDRRAMNAPIQGMAADMGHTANRLYHLFMWETLLKFGYVDEDTREMPCVIEVMVHDSMQQQARYDLFLISAYILQWVCTIGITEYYKKNFNVVFTVPPEIELEVGADMNSLYKWDFSINGENGIKAIVKKALLDQKASGRCDDIKDAYKAIMDIPQEVKDYLDEKFPVLPAYEPPEEIEAYFERKPFF